MGTPFRGAAKLHGTPDNTRHWPRKQVRESAHRTASAPPGRQAARPYQAVTLGFPSEYRLSGGSGSDASASGRTARPHTHVPTRRERHRNPNIPAASNMAPHDFKLASSGHPCTGSKRPSFVCRVSGAAGALDFDVRCSMFDVGRSFGFQLRRLRSGSRAGAAREPLTHYR